MIHDFVYLLETNTLILHLHSILWLISELIFVVSVNLATR